MIVRHCRINELPFIRTLHLTFVVFTRGGLTCSFSKLLQLCKIQSLQKDEAIHPRTSICAEFLLRKKKIFKSAMEQKTNEVLGSLMCITFESFWRRLMQSSLSPSPVSHHHLPSEAHEEQVQVHRGGAAVKEGEQVLDFCSVPRLLCPESDLTGASCLI